MNLDSLPERDWLHVNNILNEFEKQLQQGENPNVIEAADRAKKKYRDALLTELIKIEANWTRKRGETPKRDASGQSSSYRRAEDVAFSSLKKQGVIEHNSLHFSRSSKDGLIIPSVGANGHEELGNIFARGRCLLGRYVLNYELGRGGMGQVYEAKDNRLGRSVAVKVIHPKLIEAKLPSPGIDFQFAHLRKIFTDEVHLGARLNHHGIASVYDFGFYENYPFAVFEYVAGNTLRKTISRERSIPLSEVKRLLPILAQALDYAHDMQVIHRDLKPENIIISQHGQPIILDLGLAKSLQQTVDWNGFEGTPAYSSPEQAACQPCDAKSDQYALALIVLEMLTGRRLFESEDPSILLEMHRSSSAADILKSFRFRREVEAALEQALSKAGDERFDSCASFAAAFGCEFFNQTKAKITTVEETFIYARGVMGAFLQRSLAESPSGR